MKLLLDTHTIIWLMENEAAIPVSTRLVVKDAVNQLFISPASFWEMAIKVSTGKLVLARPIEEIAAELLRQGAQWLPIKVPHLTRVQQLLFHYRDPFDRLLIAQALMDRLVVVTRDAHFSAYDVEMRWDD
jgi:PIN domain nuclease of toxin-antitoxin system